MPLATQPHATHARCCHQSALRTDAGFCNECGKPLIRCMASTECGGLLDDAGLCHVCVNPVLALDAGAAAMVRAGGKLALPLTITNASPVGRPLFVTGLWMREDDGNLIEVPLPFKRLDPGVTVNIGIRTGVLEYAGMHQVDLRLAVSTRYQWREEEYVFSSAIIFPVEGEDPSGPVTNVVVQGDAGAGFTVYNPTRIESDRAAGRDTHNRPIELNIARADEAERKMNRRGYEDGLIVPRSVKFAWSGFDEGDAPFAGPILRPSGLVCFGRNATNLETGANDVRLIASRKDQIDETLSLGISRQHFTLYVESGKLMLRVDSQFGIQVNNEHFGRTKTTILRDGDVICPLRKSPGALSVTVAFETQQDTVTCILVKRTSQ